MTEQDRKLIIDCAETCEYRLQVADDVAQLGRHVSAEENIVWAELASASAFFVAARYA